MATEHAAGDHQVVASDGRALIVLIEGVDGAGKTTQVELARSALAAAGLRVAVAGPFSTTYGAMIRNAFMNDDVVLNATPTSQLLLLASAMNQTLDELSSRPADVILFDRFLPTTVAYHGAGLELGEATVLETLAPLSRRFTPDISFLLDLPIEVTNRRKSNDDRIERMDISFHQRVRSAYLRMSSLRRLDAAAAAQSLHETIMDAIYQALQRNEGI